MSTHAHDEDKRYTPAELTAAVLQERERCAKICEAECEMYDAQMEHATEERWGRFLNYRDAAKHIAAAIRKNQE
jgi:NAD-dependent dihydropyrimidine dehydrogenase PreA subunit